MRRTAVAAVVTFSGPGMSPAIQEQYRIANVLTLIVRGNPVSHWDAGLPSSGDATLLPLLTIRAARRRRERQHGNGVAMRRAPHGIAG